PGTFVQGNQYIVVAADPRAVETNYNITGVFGPWNIATNVVCSTNVVGMTTNITCTTNVTGGKHLSSSGTIKLVNNSGGVALQIPYSSNPPWPVGADGTGHSLVLARASYGEADPQAWATSDQLRGSPGRQ